jgi:hypothetical protein
MAKKGIAKKKDGKKGAKALTPRQLHARVSSLLSGKALTGKAAEAFAAETMAALAAPGAAAAAAVAKKPVTFTCSNFGCLVAITTEDNHFVFSGTGGANFKVGDTDVFFGVQGPPNQGFAITVQGGTLDFPISSTLTAQGKAGGMRTLTVKA